MKDIRRSVIGIIIIAALIMGAFTACESTKGSTPKLSSKPCETCGKTQTQGYMNNETKEAEYYCKACSSKCEFCSEKATKHYTSLLGIVFVCEECYEDIME